MLNIWILLLLFPSSIVNASVDPAIQWKTIETSHFEVIYPAHLEMNGQLYANSAEKAYNKLLPIFKEAPNKTLLFLDDSTDLVNGFASFFPYPLIVLYLNLPNPHSDISSYEDWVEMLLIHEYSHILNMHPVHGFYTPLKYIFGNIVKPNALLPRWYLEGLAVELESRLTKKGRLKSYSSDAQLRTLVKESLLRAESIDRINQSNIPEWPGGRRPYLLGSVLMQEVLNFNHQPDENIYYLNQRYSKRLPFFINGPVKDLIDYDWQEGLDLTYSKIESAANYQIKTIEQGDQKQFEMFNFDLESQLAPSISPNGKYLAFVAGNYHDGFGIYLHNFEDGNKVKKIISGAGIDKISWLPDSSGFVFPKQQAADHYNIYGDLFLYKLNDESLIQLTKKARALEPEVSTDGQYIYFIQSGASRSALARFSISNSHIEVLWQSPLNHRFYNPAAINKNQIIIGKKGTQGLDQVFLYDDNINSKTPVLKSFSSIYGLKTVSQGMLFVSDQSGVPNLYLANKTFDNAIPLTNSTTAVLNGDYSSKNKKLIISQYAKKGPQLYFTENMEKVKPVQIPPLMNRSLFLNTKQSEARYKLTSDIDKLEDLKVYKNREYASSDFLVPQYWIPFIYPVEGGVLLQASTSAGDPLDKQNYSLGLSYDSLSQALSGAISYLNQMTVVGIGLGYGLFNEYRSGSGQEIKTQSASLSTHYHLSSDNAWNGSVGGYYARTDKSNNQELERLGGTLGINYSNTGHFNYQARDNTLSAGISFQKFFEQGEFLDYERIFSHLRFDLKKPLKSRHTFSSQVVSSYAYNLNLLDSIFIGDTNLGANYYTNLVNSSFLLRGYPSGTFVGRTMTVTNFEYTFPLYDIYSGFTTSPVFLNEIYSSIFIDALTVDGAAYSQDQNAFIRKEWGKEFFASAGTELILSTTLGFHLPAYFKIAYYYGFDAKYQGGSSLFLSFGFGSFESLGEKPKVTSNFYR